MRTLALLLLVCTGSSWAGIIWPSESQLREALLSKRGLALYYQESVTKLSKLQVASKLQ